MSPPAAPEEATRSSSSLSNVRSSSDHSAERERGYLPIENYGMIGNMRTCAMVGTDGSVDFMCFPQFDSPSIFARILDQHKGGHYHVESLGETRQKQQYLPNSNILQTRFLSEEGVIHVTDFMPVPPSEARRKPLLPWLTRVVECKRGTSRVRIECFPAFDYARAKHTTEVMHGEKNSGSRNSDGSFSAPGASVVFKSDCGLTMDLRHVVYCSETTSGIDVTDPKVKCDSKQSVDVPEIEWHVEHREKMLGPGVWAEVVLKEGQRISMAFREQPKEKGGEGDPDMSNELMESLLKQTFNFWIKWIGKSKFTGRWREVVHRSALALKLMTFEPTGAVVAAPTFGIPESIGGERNWDYRYTWIRDSAFTIYALIRIGLTDEAEGFMSFIEGRCQELTDEGALQVMYTIDGAHELPEISLEHLEGYRGSQPVRIGNGAYQHLQLDIYGELMDSIYLYNKYRAPVSYDTWVQVRKLINYVCNNWMQQDMSIWEVRGMKKHFTYSKIMCWVALDRALRLSDKRSLPCPDRDRWLKTRDEIYEAVMTKGWSIKRQCFIQCFDDQENPCLDASVLIMPLSFFISPSDPRMISTLKQIMMPPEKGGLLANNLVYRYDRTLFDDGLDETKEGTFSMCTFWLVEALTRAGRQHPEFLERAIVMFEQMIAYGNHLDLFSEEIAGSGEMLGNFPQAFTHIAMMSAAFNLDRALSGGGSL
ncbi:hypothetical protein HKX48_008014 [Thoreauomyces humboldtii]|nr:hypothetical protein HKX48_008014 [Thoreauomyces humboldtii]